MNQMLKRVFPAIAALLLAVLLLPVRAFADTGAGNPEPTTNIAPESSDTKPPSTVDPVPRVPNDEIPMAGSTISLYYNDANGRSGMLTDGGVYSFPLTIYSINVATADHHYLRNGEHFYLNVSGPALQTTLAEDAYDEIRNVYGIYSYWGQDKNYNDWRDHATGLSFHKFARRIGNTYSSFVPRILMDIRSDYTLEELRQYACARDFVNATQFYCSDEIVVLFYGYEEDFYGLWIYSQAGGDVVKMLDDRVVADHCAGWATRERTQWYITIHLPKTTENAEEVLAEYRRESSQGYVVETETEYILAYLCARGDDKPSWYAPTFQRYLEEEGKYHLIKGTFTCELEPLTRTEYYTYYDFTYRDMIRAWADEMDTWSGHWDFYLYGDEHFQYSMNQDSHADPGYYYGNWGNNVSRIVDQVDLHHYPVYSYVIEGPGEYTFTATGTHNLDGLSNLTGSNSFHFTLYADNVPGDANVDGKVTSADAALVLRSLVWLDWPSSRGRQNADVDGDGSLSAADAAAILRYVVKLTDRLPV
jgi:hypothetical protein